MKKIGYLFLVYAVLLSAVGGVSVFADGSVVMVANNNGSSELANGKVVLSGGTWSTSQPATDTEKENYGGPNGEDTFYSSTENASATFTPAEGGLSEGYYQLNFYKILYEGKYSRPVVKFEIYHNGETGTEIFNFNEDPSANKKEWVDLGTYYFKGDGTEYVKAINTTSGCTMRVSALQFAASDQNAEIAADRSGILVTDAKAANSGWSKTEGHPRCVTAKGEQNVYSGTAANAFLAYSAETLPEAGYYDVYMYKVVYAPASAPGTENITTAKANIFIYHDGRQDRAEIDYSSAANYTTVWEKLGTYFFSGNAANEYISIENTVAGQWMRVGGVKFVPASAPTEGCQEVTVRATIKDDDPSSDDPVNEEHTSKNNFSWAGSSAVLSDDGSTTLYSTAQGARFTFYADELEAGEYKVFYYRSPYTTGNDDNIWMTVAHNGKTDGFRLNCSVGEKEWVYVGEYDFAGGTKEDSVTIMRVQPHDAKGVSTRATAVKFVKNAPEETDTFIIPLNLDKTATKGANLASGGGDVTTSVPALTYEGVFSNFVNEGYRRYYLPTSGAKAGVYKVYAAATPYNNANNEAITVTVKHSEGEYTGTFNGNQPTGYYEIGEFKFEGRGNDEFVELKQMGEQKLTRLGAVKFVRQADAEAVPSTGKLAIKQADFGSGLGELSAAVVADGASLALRAAVYNDSDAAAQPPVVFAAVYDGDVLKNVTELRTAAKEIGPVETAYYVGNLPVREYNAGETIKMFVWQEGLMPVDAAMSIAVVE